MKVPTEAQRSHIYTQVENATDATTAEFLVGMLPTSDNDRLATHKDVQLAAKQTQIELTTLITEKIAALQATTTRWMLTLLITIIAAMAAVYFAP